MSLTDIKNETMLFIGVTTGKSFVNGVFPEWASAINSNCRLLGIDLELNSEPHVYRSILNQIKKNPNLRGALVTTHKTRIFEFAYDLFEKIDPDSDALKETGVVYKRNNVTLSGATDPEAQQEVLKRIIPENHWENSKGHCLILGAGGAGVALGHLMLNMKNGPEKIIITDTSEDRVRLVNEIFPYSTNHRIKVVKIADKLETDLLISHLPNCSLIANATGLGKDRPGSPISSNTLFPRNSIVWEFNYRGDLLFLEQAKFQINERGVRIEDGWRYFIFGWFFVMSKIFNFIPTKDLADKFIFLANETLTKRYSTAAGLNR